VRVIGACWLSLASALACCGVAMAADTLRVDCSDRYQRVRGLGTSIAPWIPELRSFYASDGFASLYLDELGASALRIPLDPGVLPEPIDDPQEIRFGRFRVGEPGVASTIGLASRLQAAQSGKLVVIASVWSPPAWMKTNGVTTGGGRLRDDRRAHFGRYVAEWVRGLRDVYGLRLLAVSLQNEPGFAQRWESCLYDPAQYAATAAEVARALAREDLDVGLVGPEHMTTRGAELESYATAVMHQAQVGSRWLAFASHGFPSGPAKHAPAGWEALRRFGRELWVTETSGEAPDWDGALDGLGGKLHNALAHGDASLFTYWQIAETSATRFALMQLASPTPKFQVARHFFHAARPGSRRVETTATSARIEASAFLSADGDSLGVVVLNRSLREVGLELEPRSCPALHHLEVFLSDADRPFVRLPPLDAGSEPVRLTVPARSIVSLVGR
jgi:O-glycosyl hydrolase